MPSIDPNPDWEDPPKPRSVLRKPRQPVAVYDLSKKQDGKFFSCLGKLTLICVFGSLLIWAIYSVLHKGPSSATAPSTGASAASAPVTVTGPPSVTQPVVSGDPPQVSSVAFWGITASGVTISWSTNVPATTEIAYGTTPSLGQATAGQTEPVISHSLKLTGLDSGTTYYFAAKSTGANGVTATSSTYSFNTLVGPPTISEIQVAPGSHNTLEISWKTSVPTYSYVQLGSTTTYNRFSTRTQLTTNPHVSLAFVPSGLVHYQLVSANANGNQAISPDYTLTEPSDTNPAGAAASPGFASTLKAKLRALKNFILRRHS